MRMLASLALPDVPYHALPLVEEDLVDLLRQHLDENPGGCEGVTARDVGEVLLKFYDDGYALFTWSILHLIHNIDAFF